MDEWSRLIRWRVSEALKATGHDHAARAMLRITQRSTTPLGADLIVVGVFASRYDIALLKALTGKSDALEDAYRQAIPYPWVSRFLFNFAAAEEEMEDDPLDLDEAG